MKYINRLSFSVFLSVATVFFTMLTHAAEKNQTVHPFENPQVTPLALEEERKEFLEGLTPKQQIQFRKHELAMYLQMDASTLNEPQSREDVALMAAMRSLAELRDRKSPEHLPQLEYIFHYVRKNKYDSSVWNAMCLKGVNQGEGKTTLYKQASVSWFMIQQDQGMAKEKLLEHALNGLFPEANIPVGTIQMDGGVCWGYIERFVSEEDKKTLRKKVFNRMLDTKLGTYAVWTGEGHRYALANFFASFDKQSLFSESELKSIRDSDSLYAKGLAGILYYDVNGYHKGDLPDVVSECLISGYKQLMKMGAEHWEQALAIESVYEEDIGNKSLRDAFVALRYQYAMKVLDNLEQVPLQGKKNVSTFADIVTGDDAENMFHVPEAKLFLEKLASISDTEILRLVAARCCEGHWKERREDAWLLADTLREEREYAKDQLSEWDQEEKDTE